METNNYNSYGYLASISCRGTNRWTMTGMNARGQVTSGQYGSSISAGFGIDNYRFPTSITAGSGNSLQNFAYNFNPVTGNLNWRQNNKYTGLREDFYYDGLSRLDYIMKGAATTLDMAYHYDKGGIITKSDVGSFLYSNTTKPYALSQINETSVIIPITVDSLTYTSFESVNTISEGIYSATFVYNPENERARMEIKQSGSTILTRWYLGSDYIKETSGGVTKEYSFIGGDAYNAPCVAIKQQGLPTRFYYLLRDHLGSITGITDSTGVLLYQYSFDSWGRMRDPATWVPFTPSQITQSNPFVAGRGFTGHEHLPWFSTIYMNGRLYDPLTGQFLSPDNNVQAPDFTQNLNRYVYCVNNPLKYTDPDGEFFLGTIFTFIGDFLKTTLFHGGFSFNKNVRREAWKDFDPSASWSATNKAWKIDIGGFKTDPHRTIVGRSLQFLSRWTWELPQTLFGKDILISVI